MIIKGPDFKLELVSGDKFDLELLRIINKGKSNERSEFRNEAYGISLETAIRYITNYRISNNFEVLSLKEYLSNYKNIINSIKKLVEVQ